MRQKRHHHPRNLLCINGETILVVKNFFLDVRGRICVLRVGSNLLRDQTLQNASPLGSASRAGATLASGERGGLDLVRGMGGSGVGAE